MVHLNRFVTLKSILTERLFSRQCSNESQIFDRSRRMNTTVNLARSFNARELINLECYPIDIEGHEREILVSRIHAELVEDGCAVVKGFLSSKGIQELKIEAEGVSKCGHRSFNRTNPYFTKEDLRLPADDPRRAFFARSNNFIAADNFTKSGPLRTVHDFPAFDIFIKDCLKQERFYRYCDPLADVIINMTDAGNGFPWHFDTNNFTVTLAIQNAEVGGEFQYAPNIRVEGENFYEVRKVLDGLSNKVVTLELEPGDLQLFKGRYSLHRVTPLGGPTPRFVAIFSYVDEPDMVATPERCKQLYGRALPIHFERAGRRTDRYID